MSGSVSADGTALPRLPIGLSREDAADVVVVGSGAAGATAAIGTARAGRKTVVITKAKIGAGSYEDPADENNRRKRSGKTGKPGQ